MGAMEMAGVALLVAMLLLLLRELRPAMAPVLRLTANLFFFGSATRLLAPVLMRLQALLSLSDGSGYTEVLLTAVGIALICEFAATLCRDLGESSIAEGLLLFGRMEILVMALPLIDRLLEMAREMLAW